MTPGTGTATPMPQANGLDQNYFGLTPSASSSGAELSKMNGAALSGINEVLNDEGLRERKVGL